MDVSQTGILITAPADGAIGNLMLTWIDREGRSEPLQVPQQPYASLALSPDETRVVTNIGNSIAVVSLARSSPAKLTLPARAESPVWSPVGNEIFYLSGMKLIAVPVGAKGEEFIAAENPNPGAQASLDVVLNWFAEVRCKISEAKGQSARAQAGR